MSKVIDINKDKEQCELCMSFFPHSEIYGHDEDGCAVCNRCMGKLSQNEEIEDDEQD